jgi:hypothetical protein
VMAGAGEHTRPPANVLALAGRTALVPPRVVRAAAALLQDWFRAPIVVLVLASVVTTDLWAPSAARIRAEPKRPTARPSRLGPAIRSSPARGRQRCAPSAPCWTRAA